MMSEFEQKKEGKMIDYVRLTVWLVVACSRRDV